MRNNYDVVVIGGGAAGLNGALALARSLRSVLVIDSGEPRNAPAAHMHNYLGRDGTPPGDLLAAGRDEVSRYGGDFVAAEVENLAQTGPGFTVTLADGRAVDARRLLVATGLTDELPDIPGIRQRWGRDVLHCPYCHGWETRDQRVGVLATGPMASHQAQLWRQLTSQVTMLLHEMGTPDDAPALTARGIDLVEGAVVALEIAEDRLAGVRLASGRVIPLDALAVAPRFTARAEVLAPLGLKPVDMEMNGHVIGSYIPADANGATAVPGVWVAGNITDLRAQVIVAAGAGLNAGAAINADLVAEEVRRALDA